MTEPHERLRQARAAAGFASAKDAALALGIQSGTLTHHENGTRGFSKSAARYARFFKVSLDWLLIGRGEMRPRRAVQTVPLMGVVAAGSSVLPVEDAAGNGTLDDIQLPEPGTVAAVLVKGESMWPRFMENEIVLYDPTPRQPAMMIGRYVIAQTLDGRVMIKKLQRGRSAGKWTLWSHNLDPEEDVDLLTTYAVLGVLTGR